MFGVKIVHYFGSGIFQNFEGPQNVVTSTPRPSAPSFPQDVFHRLLCSVAVGDDQPRAGHGRTSVAAPEAMKQDNKGCVGSQSQFVTPKISAHKQPHGNTDSLTQPRTIKNPVDKLSCAASRCSLSIVADQIQDNSTWDLSSKNANSYANMHFASFLSRP